MTTIQDLIALLNRLDDPGITHRVDAAVRLREQEAERDALIHDNAQYVQRDTKRLAEVEELRKALFRSMAALDDWLADFADTESKPERVTEARNRIMEYGTIGYIANVQQQNRAAMKEPK
jgi:hypothetical protein